MVGEMIGSPPDRGEGVRKKQGLSPQTGFYGFSRGLMFIRAAYIHVAVANLTKLSPFRAEAVSG